VGGSTRADLNGACLALLRFGSEADIRAVAGGCWLLTRAVTPFVATTNPKVSTTPSSNGFIS
jgi:hypothetical protein